MWKFSREGNLSVFFFFFILSSSRKFTPRENKAHMNLLRKYDKYRENYPQVKGLCNIFVKFPPSENNHILQYIWNVVEIKSMQDDYFKE